MVTISIYLLKDYFTDPSGIYVPDYTEWAYPLNSPSRHLDCQDIDVWTRKRLKENKWPFYSMSRESSDAMEHLQQIAHGFEQEEGALLYVNHPYVMIDDIARNILTYGPKSVVFAYGKGKNKVKYVKHDPT